MIESNSWTGKNAFWYLLNSKRVGWSDLGRRGLSEGVGNCLKYLKRQWSRKERRGNKDFKKGGGESSIKGWDPLRNYDILILDLKSDSHLPKIFFIICFNDSLSKMMKTVFYFILKALFVLKIFRFLSWLFGHV